MPRVYSAPRVDTIDISSVCDNCGLANPVWARFGNQCGNPLVAQPQWDEQEVRSPKDIGEGIRMGRSSQLRNAGP